MTEPLKLRVGGVYLNHKGERVEIVKDNTGNVAWYPFQSLESCYTSNGRWYIEAVTPFDLVSEVTEAPEVSAAPADDDLRTRIATAAMTGILAGTGLGIARSRLPRPDQVADMAVDYADALIAALKNDEK